MKFFDKYKTEIKREDLGKLELTTTRIIETNFFTVCLWDGSDCIGLGYGRSFPAALEDLGNKLARREDNL